MASFIRNEPKDPFIQYYYKHHYGKQLLYEIKLTPSMPSRTKSMISK